VDDPGKSPERPERPALRVVHLVHNFPPEFLGGTERYVSELVLLQREAGLEVAVIAGSERRDDARARAEESWQGIPVHRVYRRRDERFGVEFLPARALATAGEVLRSLAPDVVHLHHWFNLGDRLLDPIAPVPAVISFHDAYAACPRFFFLRPDGFFCGGDLPVPVERCVECVRPDDGDAGLRERLEARRARVAREIGRAEVALVPSEHHAGLLAAAGLVPRSKLRALPLGLARAPRRVPHVPAAGRLRLVTFGNLSRLKGLDLIFDALRALPAGAPVELHLFGEPLAAEAAELRAGSRGLPVTWHGGYDLDSLAAAAGTLDLALFPSRAHETYSLVVEEAIAAGLPVVVSDRGAPALRIAVAPPAAPFGRAIPVADGHALRATLGEFMDHPGRLAAMRAALPARPHLLADHERELRAIYSAVAAARGGMA
jgi:glycosyltransferase involved in cell wall biosynthesis